MKSTIEQFHQFREQFSPATYKSLSQTYFAWKFNHPGWDKGYLHLEKDGDEVMGSIAYCAKRILVFGAPTNSAEIGDSYTSPKYQRRGVFTTCAKACVDVANGRSIDLIYGTPNDASLPGYEKKLNFLVASHAKVALLTRLVSAAAFSRRIRKFVRAEWVSLPLAHAAVGIIRAYFWMRRSAVALRLVRVDALPESIGEDGAWGRDRKDYAFFTVRDRRYLQWRFLDSPEPFDFHLAILDNIVVGYVITKMTERQGERVGSICDFVCNGDHEKVARVMIDRAIQYLTSIGADYVQMYCAAGTEYWQSVKRLGFRTITWNPVIVFAGHPLGRDVARRSGKWHFTMSDCDAV